MTTHDPSAFFEAAEEARAERFGGYLARALGTHVVPMSQAEAEAMRPIQRSHRCRGVVTVCEGCGLPRVTRDGYCQRCRPKAAKGPRMCELCGKAEALNGSRRCGGCGAARRRGC